MTLTLAPETETRLRMVAEETGMELTELHSVILARGLEEAEARLQADAEAELQDTLAGLDRSMADVAAGRWITSEELDRRLEARADAARAKINNAQSPEPTPAG